MKIHNYWEILNMSLNYFGSRINIARLLTHLNMSFIKSSIINYTFANHLFFIWNCHVFFDDLKLLKAFSQSICWNSSSQLAIFLKNTKVISMISGNHMTNTWSQRWSNTFEHFERVINTFETPSAGNYHGLLRLI